MLKQLCGSTVVVSKCPPVTEFLTSSENIFWIATDRKDSDYGFLHEPDASSTLSALNDAIKFCLNKDFDNINYSSKQLKLTSWEHVATKLLDNILP